MDLGIAGKSVFFTGGSKGMGREAAAMLAAEGCKVAIVARTKHDIDEAVDTIKDAGGTAIGVSADITNRDDVERVVAEVRVAFGPPLHRDRADEVQHSGRLLRHHGLRALRRLVPELHDEPGVPPARGAARDASRGVGPLRAYRIGHREGTGGLHPPCDRQRERGRRPSACSRPLPTSMRNTASP